MVCRKCSKKNLEQKAQLYHAHDGPCLRRFAANTIVSGRWALISLIANGSFGTVYAGVDLSTQTYDSVAIKFANSEGRSQMENEIVVYSALTSRFRIDPPLGFAKVHKTITNAHISALSGDHSGLRGRHALVMQRLGSDLQRMMVKGPLPLGAALAAGKQCIERLSTLHGTGYIHLDVKPSNFAIGLPPRARILHAIDFGLSQKLNEHGYYSNREQAYMGTARFASYNALRGQPLSRRDDLLSVLYLIVYVAKGSLPWKSAVTNYKGIAAEKEKISMHRLCEGLPVAVPTFGRYARRLKLEDEPDYEYVTILLERAIREAGGGGILASGQ